MNLKLGKSVFQNAWYLIDTKTFRDPAWSSQHWTNARPRNIEDSNSIYNSSFLASFQFLLKFTLNNDRQLFAYLTIRIFLDFYEVLADEAQGWGNSHFLV